MEAVVRLSPPPLASAPAPAHLASISNPARARSHPPPPPTPLQYWGTCSGWGRGKDRGPWVMADLENGLWAGADKYNANNTPITTPFVTAMVKGGANGFALKAQDATAGTLQTMWDGPRPAGYQPMKKQGAIILGCVRRTRARYAPPFLTRARALSPTLVHPFLPIPQHWRRQQRLCACLGCAQCAPGVT